MPTPTVDARIPRFVIRGIVGQDVSVAFHHEVGMTSLAVWAGVFDDVDDSLNADVYEGVLSTTTLANDTATVTVTFPTETAAVPLRLVIDGAVEAVGHLRPARAGALSGETTQVIELTSTPAANVTMELLGQRGPEGPAGPAGADGADGVSTAAGVVGLFTGTPDGTQFLRDDGTLAPAEAAAGVSDHGALTGLADDDHTQYALADGSRGAFAATGHTHDDRYYTESEVDTALAGKADTGHTHSYEPAGTVAAHEADTTGVHGIADTAALLDTGDVGVTVEARIDRTGAVEGQVPKLQADGTLAFADDETASGSGATNLAWNAALSQVTSDTGTDATLTVVDATNPGLMTVADKTKLDGIEAGATGDQTAAEILTAVKTVDGTGSGLDADLLDGQEASAFAAAGHNHDGTYQPADSDLTTIAAANNGTVLAGTTASFTTADETKLDGIETGATADQTGPEILALIAGDVSDQTHTVAPRRIFETALGVWTADAPAGRGAYDDTIEFVGVTDPSDATNGIATPANIVIGDRWTPTSSFVA